MGKREKTNESSQSINQSVARCSEEEKTHKVQKSKNNPKKNRLIIRDMHEGNGGLFL